METHSSDRQPLLNSPLLKRAKKSETKPKPARFSTRFSGSFYDGANAAIMAPREEADDNFDFPTDKTPVSDNFVCCSSDSRLHHTPTKVLLPFFLICLGFVVGLLGVGIDILIYYLGVGQDALLALTDNIVGGFFIWLAFTITLMMTSILLTQYIGPAASGSGIPELKTLLSGIWLKNYLTLRVLAAKVIALPLAIGSGAILGKEGPLVHMASTIANQMSKRIGIFRKLRKTPSILQQVLSAGCAIGVASNFGAPIGGIFFSIEVTSTFYPISNYWFASVTSLVGGGVFTIMWNLFLGADLETPYFPSSLNVSEAQLSKQIFSPLMFVTSLMIGTVGGLLGPAMVFIHSKIVSARENSSWWIHRVYPYAFLVAFLTAVTSYPGFHGQWMGKGQREFLDFFFRTNTQPDDPELIPNLFEVHLLLFIFTKIPLQIMTASLHVPLGVLMPSLMNGAGIGSLFGFVLQRIIPVHLNPPHPALCALVGAASLATGVTHTLSTTVLLMEATRNISIFFPVMTGVIVAGGKFIPPTPAASSFPAIHINTK